MMAAPSDQDLDWRAYFARFGPRLVLFARQWLSEAADAEDAVQEGFVRFWRRHPSPSEAHAGLLFAAVRSAALDHLRRESRRKRREVAASEDDSVASVPLLEADPAGTAPAVEAALGRLPAEQREVLVLKVWGGLTFAQIGLALQLSPNTVSSRYRYSINALRKILRPTCHE